MSEYARFYKVVLLGECGVGKTSIISRYINNIFNSNYEEDLIAGGKCGIKNVLLEDENQMIQFKIWNTIGQERFRSLTKLYYNNVDAFVLIYDITSERSFEELKNYWVNDIKKNGPPNASKK